MNLTLKEVAGIIGGTVVGDGSVLLSGVAGIREAGPGQLTFLANPKYERYLTDTGASAVVVSEEYRPAAESNGRPFLVAEDAYGVFVKAMELFAREADRLPAGVHPSASVADSAKLGENVSVGAKAVVMDDVEIGDGAAIHAGVYLGRGVTVGRDSVMRPNVTIEAGCVLGERVIVHPGTVIGSDGFGFAPDGDCQKKIPQLGNVVIEDDVEIGSNVSIDRATVGSTFIGKGTKIDNLVQIAHNVRVGEGSLIVAQAGISGSTVVGKRAVLGGQAGVGGHIEIGDGAMVGAQAGVTRSIPAGERVSGYPAQKHSLAKRLHACVMQLPSLFKRVKSLEKKVTELEKGD